MPVIGLMSARSPEDSEKEFAAFRRGLSDAGFVEGQNVTIESRWARGQYDLLPSMAADFVSRQVSVIAAVGGTPPALAAKAATSTIPIVFSIGSDAIDAGLVESLNRPSGNLTGVTVLTTLLEPKRLGLLRDLVPGISLIGVLVNPKSPVAARQLRDIEQSAQMLNQSIFIANASSDHELKAAFESLAEKRVGALLVTGDGYLNTRRDYIVKQAERQRLPAMYQFRGFVVAGGLLSYGLNVIEAYRQASDYVARILKGMKPADLPVMQPTKSELVINLKAAKAIDIKISDNLLSIADEIIE